jgi:hypothetical protein
MEKNIQEKAIEFLGREITKNEFCVIFNLKLALENKGTLKENLVGCCDEEALVQLAEEGFIEYTQFGDSIVIKNKLKEFLKNI